MSRSYVSHSGFSAPATTRTDAFTTPAITFAGTITTLNFTTDESALLAPGVAPESDDVSKEERREVEEVESVLPAPGDAPGSDQEGIVLRTMKRSKSSSARPLLGRCSTLRSFHSS